MLSSGPGFGCGFFSFNMVTLTMIMSRYHSITGCLGPKQAQSSIMHSWDFQTKVVQSNGLALGCYQLPPKVRIV